MTLFNPGWYLIYTRPQQEKKTAYQLSTKKIEHFLPTIKSKRQWHDRIKLIDMPIFPCYIFVKVKNVAELYNGLETEGACYYVKFGKDLANVSETVVDQIKLAVNKGQNVKVSGEYFRPSQKVIINKGPLTGLTGEVIQLNGKSKILIRVDLLNRSLLVDLPVTHLAEHINYPMAIHKQD